MGRARPELEAGFMLMVPSADAQRFEALDLGVEVVGVQGGEVHALFGGLQ
jgi:hypothetical protein